MAEGYIKPWKNRSTDNYSHYYTPAGKGVSVRPEGYVHPSEPCSTCPAGSLIGKLGVNGRPFYIGNMAEIKNAYGDLYVMVNDYPVHDNVGSFVLVLFSEVSNCLLSNRDLQKEGENENDFDVTIFPNPTSGELFIEINDSLSSNAQVQLIDVTGAIIYEEDVIKNENDNIYLNIGNKNLPTSTYYVRIVNGKKVVTKPIVINK